MQVKLAILARRWSWGSTALVLAVVASAVWLLGDVKETDLYWHVLMGRDILMETRLTGDPYVTFGPFQDWISTQSVSELFGFFWLKLFGLESFAALRVIAGVVAALVLAWSVLRVSPRYASSALKFWVAAASVLVVTMGYTPIQERPQTATFIILPIFAVMVVRALYTGRFPALPALFALVLVWTWFHGAGLLAAPLLAYVWLVRLLMSRSRLHVPSVNAQPWWFGLAAAGTAVLATFVNPLGVGLYQQALRIPQSASVHITEWAVPFESANWLGVTAPLFLGSVWLLCIMVLRRHGFSYRSFLLDVAYMVPLFAYLELSNRNVALSAILVAPVIGRRLVQALSFFSVRSRYRPWAFVVAAVATVMGFVFVVFSLSQVRSVDSDVQPARIYAGLASTVGERRVINDYNLSGRLQLLTQPQVRTAIDGRADRYSPDMLVDYFRMLGAASEWRDTFDLYSSASDAVIDEDAPLGDELLMLGWRLVCSDNGFSWFTAPDVVGSCPAVAGALPVNIDR